MTSTPRRDSSSTSAGSGKPRSTGSRSAGRSARWYVVVAFEKRSLPTLLLGPRDTEKEIDELGKEVRLGHHVPKEYAGQKYEWGTVLLRGVKA